MKLGIKFPALIDNFQNTTERDYTGWPDRLYVIDRDGKIAYKAGPGPFGFKPKGVQETLERLVPNIPPGPVTPVVAAPAAAVVVPAAAPPAK